MAFDNFILDLYLWLLLIGDFKYCLSRLINFYFIFWVELVLYLKVFFYLVFLLFWLLTESSTHLLIGSMILYIYFCLFLLLKDLWFQSLRSKSIHKILAASRSELTLHIVVAGYLPIRALWCLLNLIPSRCFYHYLTWPHLCNCKCGPCRMFSLLFFRLCT